MTEKEMMIQAEENIFHVYNRFPVVFERGDGVYLYDVNNKKYLDFASGIGVMAFGYNNEEYKAAITEQLAKIIHTSNLFYHPVMADAAKRLTSVSGMDKVFFTNSGAEAVEGAIKTAKKYAYLRDGHADHEIVAMEHSFHGRTVGALSTTGTIQYRTPFLPLMDGVVFATFNDYESVENAVNDKTCAILLETVQGEGGIYPADKEFLKKVRRLCDKKDIVLILDEIQCGMGRTGSMFAYQQYDILPDIVTTAKALGCGVPVGAFLVSEKIAKHSLTPGDHGTTYGGNPLCLAAVDKVLAMFEEKNIAAYVRELTPYLEKELDTLVDKYDFVTMRRGMGFMQGLVLTIPVREVVEKALETGLILLSAGQDVLRFLPPLIIEKNDIDEMIRILDDIFMKYV